MEDGRWTTQSSCTRYRPKVRAWLDDVRTATSHRELRTARNCVIHRAGNMHVNIRVGEGSVEAIYEAASAGSPQPNRLRVLKKPPLPGVSRGGRYWVRALSAQTTAPDTDTSQPRGASRPETSAKEHLARQSRTAGTYGDRINARSKWALLGSIQRPLGFALRSTTPFHTVSRPVCVRSVSDQ